MSKIMSNELIARRDHFAYLFRSDEKKISFFLRTNFTPDSLKSLDGDMIENLWDVGLYIVKEYASNSNREKAQTLLNMFANYQNTFSNQIKNDFNNISEDVNSIEEQQTEIQEEEQVEVVGITETSTATSSSLE